MKNFAYQLNLVVVTFRLKGESGWCSKYGTMLNQGKISSATGKTTKSVLEISTASSGWVRIEVYTK